MKRLALIALLGLFVSACNDAWADRHRRSGPRYRAGLPKGAVVAAGYTNTHSWDNTTGGAGDYEGLSIGGTDMDGVSQFTVCFWLKDDQNITRQLSGVWDGTQWLMSTWSNGRWRMYINEAADYSHTDRTDVGIDADWWHFCAAYNAGTITMYENAVSLAQSVTGSPDSALKTVGNPIHIGPFNTGNVDFQTQVDDWALWIGDALDASEVSAVYAGTPESAGTVTHWFKFDNDFVDSVTEVTATQINGTGDYLFSTDIPYTTR